MVGLAFAIAASANFPALLLAMTWRRFSTGGAVASMVLGTVSAVVLIALSPTVMVELLHRPHAIVSLKNPGVITFPLSFLAGVVGSLLFPDPESQAKFDDVEERIHMGERTRPRE